MLAARGHRQVADEVGQPDVGRRLELGVLVQEVIDLPRLVADPQVERLLRHQVVEHHEVGAEDLVHPPQRLERVQVVVAGLAVDVGGLAGQLGARGVDRLAARVQHGGHGLLRKPLDLEAGHLPPQLVGDRDVAPRVPEADRRGDEQRAPGARASPRTQRAVAPWRAPRPGGELAQEQVDLTRARAPAAGGPSPSRRHEIARRVSSATRSPRSNGMTASSVPWTTIAGHVRRRHSCLGRPPGRRGPSVALGGDQDLGRRVEPPRDPVLDLLGRVRLGEDLREEELEEARDSRAASSGGCTCAQPS